MVFDYQMDLLHILANEIGVMIVEKHIGIAGMCELESILGIEDWCCLCVDYLARS